MTVLVAGGTRVDAGKTTFAAGLVSFIDGTGFKPRAGNDYWFDHDDYQQAISSGGLVGKDAATLASVSGYSGRAEDINPIHRLWRPAPWGDSFLGPEDRMFVLDRYGDNNYVLNGNAAIPSSAHEAFPLGDASVVATLDELNEVMTAAYLPLLEALSEQVDAMENAVVESYGSIARPLQDISVDRVAVVDPGRVRIYDGDRYWKACEIVSGRPHDGVLEERVTDVIDVLDPLSDHELPPLSKATRSDPRKVATEYSIAYDAILNGRSEL